jgi:stage IV sporulation protein FB
MSDPSHWNLYLARLRRVHLRFHALFFAVAVIALFLSTSHPGEEAIGYGLLTVAVLLASVLAHEAGHCLVALRVGGSAEQVIIGPLGGLAFPELPREPQAEFFTALAGPIVNLAIVMLTLPVLLVAQLGILDLLSPLQPTGLIQGPWWAVSLKLAFWINWLMLLVNLLPAFPFDGARVLRALLWPALDYRSATLVAVRTTKLTAMGVCVLAWAVSDVKSAEVLPAWVPLALFAVFVYSRGSAEATRLEEADWEEELFSYDFSQGYTSLERTVDPPRRPAGSPVRRWLENRREMRHRKRRRQEQEEERQVDAILVRLHESGLEGLTAKERALLHRVSARYRNRQGS